VGIKTSRPLAGLLLACASVAAQAQDAGSLLREQERQRALEQRVPLSPAEPSESSPEAPPATPETGATLLVRELLFAGKSALLSDSERDAIAASVKGRKLGVNGLQALADRVTFTLQRKGHLLARAILPPQDATSGAVTIAILDGELEAVEFQGGDGIRARDSLMRHILAGEVDAQGVTKGDLESALLRLNELPGLRATARPRPGEAPNSTRLVVDLEQAPVFGAAVWNNNYGNSGTGREQAAGLLTLTDISGFGDETRLQATVSEGLRHGRLDLSAPVWSSGLVASFGYSQLRYENIDGIGRALELEGQAKQLSAGIDYGLIRSRNLNLLVGVDFSRQALIDDSIAGRLHDKRVNTGALVLSGDARDYLLGGGLTSWHLAWTRGDLDLSRLPGDESADAAALDTQGNFQRVNANLVRLQDLPGAFSLMARAYGQWAGKNLDSSQDFSLGGPYGVRAYPVGEGRGDLGATLSLELRYDAPFPADWGALQVATFADAGYVRINEAPLGPAANRCGCNHYDLAGAGLGLTWTLGGLSLSGSYARQLGANPGASADGERDEQSFWFQGSARF